MAWVQLEARGLDCQSAKRVLIVRRASFRLRNSCALLAAPLAWGLMHMLLEESIEVLHEAIAQDSRNCTDLGWWKYAEQPLSECQADLCLKCRHGRLILVSESSFQRSHLHPKFTDDGTEP